MNASSDDDGVHWSFWLIGVIGLLWNAAGSANFFAQTNPDVLSQMSPQSRAIVELQAGWARAAFGIAVFGGTIGCLLLLLRKPLAYYFFVASLAAMFVQMIWTMGNARDAGLGGFEFVMYVIMPLAIAVFLIWYEKRCERLGWVH